MENYSALVTGGAQGIGKAICSSLVQAGMQVLLLDNDRVAGRATEKGLGPQAHFLHGDAASEADVRRAVAQAQKLGRGLHAAVANTGISIHKPVTRLTLQQWRRVQAVNLDAPFLLAKHAAPKLKKSHGAMVLIGSSRALMSEPDWEAYGASKGGVVALAHALAISLGPAVRVNCVSPGWVATDAWQRPDRRKPPKLSAQDHAQHPAGRV
ncbi:MAG TPA: SDR family NAD(P)-dependent oxidoreductase, partial [Solimonas sp.]